MTPPAQNPGAAALLTLAAAAFIAGCTLLAKALGTDALGPALHPLQISQGRFVFALVAIGSFAAGTRFRLVRPALPLHFLRSGLGWGGVTLMFAAAAFIPLSDATAISFLNPVFGMVLAVVILGERVGPVRWTAAAIALLGALILTRPGGGTIAPGALLALAAAACLGGELIAIKFLSGRERPLQILLINNLFGCLIASAAAYFVWTAPTPAQWAALAGIGLLMATAQTCFVNAMARADASFVAPFFYATLVFAALYDAAVFSVLPDAISILGALTVLSGAALLAWREARLKSPTVPPARPL
ncbi:membrane protein [Roseovarius atlanticus]|uniref:Membrane protein n=1 Tax=Roseovarius atlanticus TaxID=1641875 RepID=A0A0T5NW73_9RHOB|nr:DMT family transporter [Roseovarius atlanticus]KRS13008.1 membrane protein [Roseovarius atlanticus]